MTLTPQMFLIVCPMLFLAGLVDAIGGAHVELTEKEVNYLNRTAGYYPDYPLQES